MIYLDNAASTQVHEEVFQEMLPYFREQYGNPSSIHRYGRLASKAIETARKRIAELINAKPHEILLTSGGTESNNTALFGVMRQNKAKQLITSHIEHDAILEPCRRLEKEGFDVIYLPVNSYGLVDIENLNHSITKETALVSVMFANNEVGTIQPIQEIVQICKQHNVLFHTDAIQAVGKIPIDVKDLGVDMLSISSHKINGPKGIGALYIRDGTTLDPFILGGGQENGMRSGTENVANIVGFGKACILAKEHLGKNASHMKSLRDHLTSRIVSEISHVSVNGNVENKTPNNAHFTFLGVNGEDLIIKLDEYGVAASTGSACSVKTQKASHVLMAMGFSHEQITGSLRITVGLYNTMQEMDQTVDILKKTVQELRSVSPFKTKYGF
ncbi:cysteine desulfurase family protein [Candidatus Nitrosotenuis sp. DW1]|uniref:cysteine desulfurase family protein n=1 Tax=Candidatus Nitrosotenuis sp. DW1 TaxID=2259672 RepID=UPI0015C7BA1E|nr:cysteine desulfurase family protein [Candidatus Nitrosotenuis sp. DW1]QLH08397.1 cysteine desulfurase NifS [Candidatus Nitrosotenuis sp. DW1]